MFLNTPALISNVHPQNLKIRSIILVQVRDVCNAVGHLCNNRFTRTIFWLAMLFVIAGLGNEIRKAVIYFRSISPEKTTGVLGPDPEEDLLAQLKFWEN